MQKQKTEAPKISNSWSALALRTAMTIAKRWKLSDAQIATLLACPNPEQLENWKRSAASGQVVLPDETMENLNLLLRTYKTLSSLFGSDENILAWMTTAHHVGPCFKGRPPMLLLTEGGPDGLWQLCIHVDAWLASSHHVPPLGMEAQLQQAGPL
jgi:hypothetical protein